MCRRDWQSLKADLSKGQLEPSANRHGSNCLITSHDLQLLPADGKWRLIVRPIQKAIIREQIVGLTA